MESFNISERKPLLSLFARAATILSGWFVTWVISLWLTYQKIF